MDIVIWCGVTITNLERVKSSTPLREGIWTCLITHPIPEPPEGKKEQGGTWEAFQAKTFSVL